MAENLAIITPTADRPEAIELCSKFVLRAIHRISEPVQWIIADGGKTKLRDIKRRFNALYIDAQPFEHPAENLCNNLLEAVSCVRSEKVVIMEDDEWYHKDYLRIVLENLSKGDVLFGVHPSIYYHLPSRRTWNANNRHHASLCCTSWCGQEITNAFIQILNTAFQLKSPWVDMKLWSEWHGKKLLHDQQRNAEWVNVGIKGLPGKPGIGFGHRPDGSKWLGDPRMQFLRNIIGDRDIRMYQALVEGRDNATG